ncbi:uncharacterized protein LOC124440918 [Xenia sp. Carnegie-2017]|uniref:uncharacterized protein LOC124440918 n=1 Tax=Xenia sp. Carnegie-2017 TaxID=2897299 RepID=UPI001F047203|nr:uncharacterized protein LOC124440918 [Xenia sp. Carnegie-2017]
MNLMTLNQSAHTKCVDNIVEDSTELVQGTVKAIKHGLQNCLEKAGLNYNDVPGLDELFDEGHAISNPFKHISTKYKQNAYFEEHFGLVQPRRIKLGHRVVKRRSRTVYKEVIKDDEIMYIPLLKSLEKMLNVKGVLEQVRLLIAWLCFFMLASLSNYDNYIFASTHINNKVAKY